MNYYEPRQRNESKLWDWTVMNDKKIRPCGACIDANCEHKTADEAREHESQRIRDLIKSGKRTEIDTKFGHVCQCKECEEKAFYEINLPGSVMPITACDKHLDDPSWFIASDRISSY